MAETTKMTLSRALLIRKELMQRSVQAMQIRKADLFETKVTRKAAHEGIDDVTAQVPKLTLDEVTKRSNQINRALREVDAVIQSANHTVEVDLPGDVMEIVDSI